MPVLTPEEAAQFDNLLEEIALAVNDAIVATTVAQKLAAKNRFKAGHKALARFQMNMIRSGVQGDY